MPPKAILFDLDGTLTDNRVGITGGCMAARRPWGCLCLPGRSYIVSSARLW